MAVKIAVANRKGGCGKSTTAICLAQELMRRGKNNRVLIIDCDGQCNATKFYGADISEGIPTVMDMLCNDKKAELVIQHCEYGDIIPADELIFDAETMIRSDEMRFFHVKFSMENLEDMYDFIVIDTPPSVGVVLKNVLAAVNYVIIPVDESGWSVDGIKNFFGTIRLAQINNPNLKILGFLVTLSRPNTNKSRRIKEQIDMVAEKIGTSAFDIKIRYSTKIGESLTEFRVPLQEYIPSGAATLDYEYLADEVLERIGMK